MSSLMKRCWDDMSEESESSRKTSPPDARKILRGTPGRPRRLYGDRSTPTKLTECYDVKLEDGSVLRLEMDGKTASVIQSFITMCGGVAPVALGKASPPHCQKL